MPGAGGDLSSYCSSPEAGEGAGPEMLTGCHLPQRNQRIKGGQQSQGRDSVLLTHLSRMDHSNRDNYNGKCGSVPINQPKTTALGRTYYSNC